MPADSGTRLAIGYRGARPAGPMRSSGITNATVPGSARKASSARANRVFMLGLHCSVMLKNLPIACSLTPDAVAARRAGLLPGLAERADAREEIADGVRLKFAPSGDVLRAIADVIEAERQCCRFLTFELTVEQDGGPVWLTLSGPEGTSEFLAALLSA